MKRTPSIPPDTTRVQRDAVYPHPPERVWRALTDPRALSRWLLPGDFAPRVGHRFTLRDGRARVRGEVIAAEENRRLSYTWRRDGDTAPSVVTWTLEPLAGGQKTRVRLTHTGPQARASVRWAARLSQFLSPRPLVLFIRSVRDCERNFR